MTSSSYFKHPVTPTKVGVKVLRARLSYRETQAEFAERFRVSKTTIHKWERGYVTRMQKIYQEILDSMIVKLQAEGRLLPEAAIMVLFKEEQAKEVLDATRVG